MKEHHRKGRLGHAGFGQDIERGAGEQVMGRKTPESNSDFQLPTDDLRLRHLCTTYTPLSILFIVFCHSSSLNMSHKSVTSIE